jgi:hypothetical protein
MISAIAAHLLVLIQSPDPAAIEQSLAARALVHVSINPESRVKAERGPAVAELRRGVTKIVVVKVLNDAGATARVAVSGPGIGADGWLDVAFAENSRLKGDRVEYLFLRLTPRESGQREATLRFDIGQGTQDLGFRAEVPILFRVRNP